VDREREVRSIIAGKDIVESGMITVLYGSKGCGKSTFFRVLSESTDLEADIRASLVL
jgi:ABC-type phosphate transport system ATPase subunit